ncbi:MAG: SDR family NAD(P)-dependent oxidoreductase [Pseudomonadota bacterium]
MSEPTQKLSGLSALKLALMAQQARERAADLLRADPIAIVGMACRIPGGADTPEQFWQLLADGRNVVTEVPPDRWDTGAWYDADPAAPGKTITRQAAFLERIDGFDAEYFGILPREAQRMDPQQRLFLEVAIEALDDAGLTRERLRGSRTGVYIASYHNDYAQMQYADVASIDPRTLTGTLHSVLANRLSYLLDLHGPSVSIDTACSSSLVAVHLACQSLRLGETDLGVAGGVSLIIGPELLVSMSKVGFMSPDGRCKTFDAAADGFGRGEGCGVIVLKRLADALADGDRVLAVVRGSAVNQDGHSTLLAAPSGPAQEALIREALAGAQLEPWRIGLMEAHGTGTALGDPIEVEAIAATLGRPAEGAGPCLLGSAKANVGHLEAAAGVTGLLKTVLALQHEAVPPQPLFERLSPHISLQGTRLAVPTRLTPWPRGAQPRCAAVSSFGVGGTNAHVIIEEAPRLPASETAADEPRVLALSAHNHAALQAQARAWAGFLRTTGASAADLCFTATQRRTPYDHRLAIVGRTAGEFAAQLDAYLAGEPGAGLCSGQSGDAPRRIGFVFSGQGPQWHAMGRELLATEPVFRETVEACDRLLKPLAGWSLLQELGADEAHSRLDQTEVAQPALFALQAGLAALWRSWGVVPDAVVGHSVGEIAALHAAGVLSLDDAVRVVWQRARIMQQATGLGGMAQVSLGEAEAAALLQPFGERLSLAAVNAPRSVVLSGEGEALAQALDTLTARGVAHRRLPVQYAFHSAQMAPFEARLNEALQGLRTAAPALEVYSTVTGRRAEAELAAPGYFGRNVRAAVRFADAIGAMCADGIELFVEIGPHPVLAAAIAECAAAADAQAVVLASLRRGKPERETLLQACAGLHVHGRSPDWGAVQGEQGQVVSLPPYAWQRQRHWLPARSAAAEAGPAGARHPLLGRHLAVAEGGLQVWQGDSRAARHWLADHRIFGREPMPAAAVMALLAEAAGALQPGLQLAEFEMERPLFLPEEPAAVVQWQTVAKPGGGGRLQLGFHAAVAGAASGWQRIAQAVAVPAGAAQALPAPAEPGVAVEPEAVYAAFERLGVPFGETFRCLQQVHKAGACASGSLVLPASLQGEEHRLHPVLLDAALQLCSVAAAPPGQALGEQVWLPVGADRVALLQPAGERLRATAVLREQGPRSLRADLNLEDEHGRLVAVVEGMRFALGDQAAFAPQGGADPWLYRLGWDVLPAAAATGATAPADWLVLADDGGVGAQLAGALAARGHRCRQLTADQVDAQQRGAFEAWLRAMPAPQAVVHLWALDATGHDETALAAAHERCVASVLHLAQAMVAAGVHAPLWLVSRGAQALNGEEPCQALQPQSAALWGLGGVIAAEHPELSVHRIDLDPAASPADAAQALLRELASASGVRDLALRGERRLAPRLQPLPVQACGVIAQQLVVQRPGTLDGLGLVPLARAALAPYEVRLQVRAAGVNFRDVMLALGLYPGTGVPLGAECVGTVVEAGDAVRGLRVGARVFGYVPASFATEAVAPAAFLAPVPDGLSDDEAAGLPIAFLTAAYGLHSLAGLQRGERVLIHAAAGGVGLAAVQLAQRAGAEVYATAGSEAKRALLRSLGVRHVMDSRTLAFADEVLAATGGQGVHVVLNSLAGDFIGASFRALGRGGRFLELGKRDIRTPEQAARERPDVGYHAYDLGSEAQADLALLPPLFDDLLRGLADGSLRPLPVQAFDFAQAAEALRFMAQARHVGKLVLRLPQSAAPAVRADATYWITGGAGALGRETARWLVQRGATHLVLSGRQEPSEPAQAAFDALRAQGATVRFVRADSGDRAQMQSVLALIDRELPPLAGIVHAAGSLADGVLANQRWDDARAVLHGKVRGAWILHELTRERPLDFFVLYSAAATLLGAAGQGVYPAANAQLDALAAYRRRLGLPGLSVAWGAWAGAGMAAEAARAGRDQWAERGLQPITPDAGFERLEALLRSGVAAGAVLPVDWARFLARLPAGVDAAFFAAVAPRQGPLPAAAPRTESTSLASRLQALPAGQRRDALQQHLRERTLQVLGLDPATLVDPLRPLKDLGVDSLMAVELRNALARSTDRKLPATLLFDHPTLAALTDHLARLLDLGHDNPAPEAPAAAPAEEAALAAMSDAEAEALLLAELDGTPAPKDTRR